MSTVPLYSALLSAVISAFVSWMISRLVLRETTARDLLLEALAVEALEEAWILEGHDAQSVTAKLSENRDLEEKQGSGKFWLRRVEVRAILDEAEWNSPSADTYGFVGTRRAWIVRNEVTARMAMPGPTLRHYPALISSRGREELCGWIERVQNAYRRPLWLIWLRSLNSNGLEMLRSLLVAVAQPDRVEVLKGGLTPRAIAFLEEIRKKWPVKLNAT